MMEKHTVILLTVIAVVVASCGPTPELMYDYRWQILEAHPWQSIVRPGDADGNPATGILLQWNFDRIQRKPNDFNARITIWRYPLDTVLVVTKHKETLPDGTYEITRMRYEIRNKPLLFDVVVIPRRDNMISITPGKYFVYVSPAAYNDIRIKEVIVKENHLSVLSLPLLEQRLE